MGQKCKPTGLRIGVITDWDSRWYEKKSRLKDERSIHRVKSLKKFLNGLSPRGDIPKVNYKLKLGKVLPIAFSKRVYKAPV